MYPYAGNYSVWLQKKATRLDLESKQDRRRQKAMEEELQWIQRGARVCPSSQAGQHRPLALSSSVRRPCHTWSVGRRVQAQQSKSKARVAAYDDMVSEHERIRASQKFLSGVITIPPAPRLGMLSVLCVCVDGPG